MSDRFDHLREQLEAAAERREQSEAREASDGPEDREPERVPSGPAFEFDDTTAKSIYVRPETLRRIDDVEALVDARLRTEHEVRDLTTREFYDAVLRVAAADPDAVVRAVVDGRVEAGSDEGDLE